MNRTRWAIVVGVWLVIAVVAIAYRESLSQGPAGIVLLVVVFAPAALAVYFLAHVLAEGVVLLLLITAFKIVTLGQVGTEITNPDLTFPWYGFARAKDGSLVASENAMAIIGIAVYAVIGFGCYLVLR